VAGWGFFGAVSADDTASAGARGARFGVRSVTRVTPVTHSRL